MKFIQFMTETEMLKVTLKKSWNHIKKIKEDVFLASFSSVLLLPGTSDSTRIKTEASSPLKSRWFLKRNLNLDYKSVIDKVFHSTILFMGPGFLSNEIWAMVATNAVTHLEKSTWNKISLHCARVARLKMINFTIWSKIIQLSKG